MTEDLFKIALKKFYKETVELEYTARSCHDIPFRIENNYSQNFKDELNRRFHEWNGDPEEYKKGNRLLGLFYSEFIFDYLTGDINEK